MLFGNCLDGAERLDDLEVPFLPAVLKHLLPLTQRPTWTCQRILAVTISLLLLADVILIKRHLEQIPVCVGREHAEQPPQRARTDTATTSGASAQCSANSHAAF